MNIENFEDIIEKMESDIYGFCLYLTRNRNRADDLYQDTIIKLFELRDRIDKDNNPKSYMFTVAYNIWKNVQRREARHQRIAPTREYEDISEYVKDRQAGPEIQLIKKEEQNMLIKAVESLEEKYRIVMILFYYNYITQEGIAQICKIPKGTVKSRLHKGRELVKKFLMKEGYEYER